MKIIDKKTGKRVGGKDREESDFKKKLKEEDPIIRNVEKGDFEELSPMDPPDGYDKERVVDLDHANMHANLKDLAHEHEEVIVQCDLFDKILLEFKEGGFRITPEINEGFNKFFIYFDEHILPHNRKEERGLFPILHKRMLETGEHSDGENPHTPIDLMEDEHVQFIQFATLSFNFLGLAMRLKDHEAKAVVYDIAYNNGKDLVESIRLHTFREDNTIFPLAQKLLTKEELNEFYG